MNRVIVIGNSYRSEVAYLKDLLSAGSQLNGLILSANYGGSYSLATNLNVLQADTYLITRFASDWVANEMLGRFDRQGGAAFFGNSSLAKTPAVFYLVDKDGQTTLINDVPYDSYPDLADGFPAIVTDPDDYGLINIPNTNYLLKAVASYPNLNWIAYNCLPEDKLLPLLAGVVMDYDYLAKLLDESQFRILASELLAKGLKWLIIFNRGKEARLFAPAGGGTYRKKESGPYFIGCYEAFVSMLTACLANGYDLDSAINHGLNLANDLSYQKNIVLHEELF